MGEKVQADTILEIAKWVGLPTLIVLLYGPPMTVLAYLLAWHWRFSQAVVENNAKISTILDTISRDGVKCRHE